MIIKFYLIAAVLLVCESCFAQAPSPEVQIPPAATTNSPIKLADGTPVVLRTKQELSSGTAKVGDRVPFRVVEDVKVGDLLVIRRGAEAWGLVTAVQPKRHKGRGGSVGVAIQSVPLLTGENVPLRAEQHSEGTSKSWWDIGPAGIGLPFLPFHMLEKGKDAYLPAGTKVTAYLEGDIALERMTLERLQPQPAMAPSTGPATVTIFRTAFPYGTGYRPYVYCGKIALARLPQSSYLKIQLPPGKYSFRSNDDQVVDLLLVAGQEIYLQMQVVVYRYYVVYGYRYKGHLVQVASSEGTDEVLSLRPLNDKDVTKASDTNLPELQAAPEVK